MAKFVVKASEFKNVLKAVNDRKLVELKKEIIEILKKQDSKEVRKAVEYFESQEKHYSHLEKSLSGKWVEKAGYGIGTVRVWKGKKYKKIAPGKWARVFEKEGRGTNIAIGRLISKVNQIDNVEDLMAFVMANKQRFVDENGNDLPVLDKLRAAVNAKNNGGVGSNGKTKKLISDYTKINEESLRKYATKLKGSKEDKLNYLLETREKRTKEIKAKEPGVDIQNHPELDALGMLYQTIANDKDPNKEFNIADDKNEKPAEKKSPEKLLKEMGFETMEKVSYNGDKWEVAGVSLDSDGNAIGVNLTPDRQSGNLKSSNVTVDDIGKIKKEKPAEKEYDRESVDDWKGYYKDFTADELKEQIENYTKTLENAKEAEKIYPSHESRQAIKENGDRLKALNELLEEKESEAEKTQNRSDAMKGNKNAYKGGLAKDTVKFVKEVKGEPYHDFETDTNKLAIYSDDGRRSSGIVMSQEIADIIDSHNEPSILDWKDNIADEINAKYPAIQKDYVRLALGGIRPGYRSGKKENVKVVSSDESKNVEEPAKETEPKDEPKKTSETKSQFKRELPAGSAKTVKENIGTFTKAGDGKVEMPATKEVAELFDSLNKAASKEENRHFMTDAYYDGENFVSTDGRRLVCIKAGDIGLDKGYVKVDTNGGKITVTALPEKKDYEFPNYKRVMPGSANTQEVKFDNKALKEKLKEMKKEGAFNKKSSTGVDIEFKDGKAYLDGTVIGSGDVKFPEGQEPFIKLNGFYLMDAALAGDSSSMFLDKDNPANKATDISTNNSDIVIMTMEPVRSDYESGRKVKADKKAAKDKAKAENRKNNEKLLASFEPTKVDRNVENVASDIDSKLSEFSDDDLKENYDKLTIDFDKVMEKPGLMSLHSKVNKNGLSFGYAYLYSQLAKRHPEIKEKFEAEMKKRGLEVKKSLFDGFLVAELLEEDVDDVEEDKEEESLWNDYSAEQPELFNSVEFKVREALNRRYCNCL